MRIIEEGDFAGSKDSRPEPPDDLWEKLDEVRRIACPYTIEQPPGTFTLKQFRERFQLNRTTAQRQIADLIATEQIEHAGSFKHNAKVYRMKKP